MGKKEKVLFIIFIGLCIILILTVNLVIKRYEEKETIPSSLPEQEDISPTEQRVEKKREREYIKEPEEIEEEGLVSGPLVY